MVYSVIYEVDVPKGSRLTRLKPRWNKRWQVTESGESEVFDGGRHRKYCGIISEAELVDICWKANLTASRVPTMGSIGAPGFGIGWAPAICMEQEWTGYDDDFSTSMYVTPVPGIDDPNAEWPDQMFGSDEEAESVWEQCVEHLVSIT